MTDRDKEFLDSLKEKHPNIDVAAAFDIINKEIKEITDAMPTTHDRRLPIDCDLIKNVMIVVVDKYLEKHVL